MARDRLLLHTTNRKYHMAYLFVPFPVTLKVIRLMQDLSNAIRRTFVRHLHGASHLTLPMKNLPWKGRGQGHVSNFYIVDLENFATASRLYTGDIHNSVRSRFVYDTYKTMEATRSRHGWLHMFITHRPTVTLQLHNFDLSRTCRRPTSSFCTVAWQ